MRKSKVGLVILSIISVIIIAFAIIFGLAISDDFKESENTVNEGAVNAKIAKSVLMNEEVTLNKDELNAIVSKKLSDYYESSEKIKNITLTPSSEEDIMYVYAKTDFWGRTWGLSAKTKVTLEKDKFKVEVLETKVGKLKIPKKMVLNKIKDTLDDIAEIEDSTIYFDSNYKMEVMGMNINLKFANFKIQNEQVTLKLRVQGNIGLPTVNWIK